MAKRGRPKKQKPIPLSEESKKLVEQGLSDIKEGKLTSYKTVTDLEKSLNTQSETPEQIERRKKLKEVMKQVNKSCGETVLDFADTIPAFEKQSFGYTCLDKLTGGGIKCGQYSTLWGDPDCGKTTIAYKMIATAQKQGKICVYINMEKSYDAQYAQVYGVDVQNLVVENCVTAEQAFDTIIRLCEAKVVDFIVLDSIHGLSPKTEQFEGKTDEMKSTEKDTQALLARKLSQFFRMSIPYVAEAKCAVLLIGQTRTSIGYVSLETLSGGRALKHYSRLILHMRRGQKSDAPTEKKDTGMVNEKGKPIFENKQIGWDCVIKVDKSQTDNCHYLDELHVPFIIGKGLRE